MILSAQSIRARCYAAAPLITPFSERTVHKCGLSYGLSSAGYDVRLGTALEVQVPGLELELSVACRGG